MIWLFKRDPMLYTPFNEPQSLARLARDGIMLTNRLHQADLLVASRFRSLRIPRMMYPWKKCLLWTDEPRFVRYFGRRAPGMFGLGDVHIMNAYTGDIFCDNFDVLGQTIDCRLEPVTEQSCPTLSHRTIAVLATRFSMPLAREGRNIDLLDLRAEIALAGHALGKVHVYGRRWPPGVAREDSRGEGWPERKLELLKQYHFNLCFENTIVPFYCSEKIWDSIRGGCLPIYYGDGTRIYDDFPPRSFIDYSQFDSPAALFEFVEQMTVVEFRRRLNLCIEVFNRVYERRQKRTYYDVRFSEQLLQRTIDRIRGIVEPASQRQIRPRRAA